MRGIPFVAFAVVAVACSSSTTNQAPDNSGGNGGTGGSVTGGTSGGGGSGGSGGSGGLGGTAGATGGMGGLAGTGGSDASLGGSAGADASLGGSAGSGGVDASVGGSGGTSTGGTSGSGGGTAGSDAGDASADAAVDASDGAAGSDAGVDASGDAGDAGDAGAGDAGDAASDAPPADAGPCPGGVTGGDGTAHYPRWKLAGDARPDTEFTASTNVVLDHTTCLMWQRAANTPTDWNTANTACDNSTLDGYTDWRLPTRAELISLTDFTRILPALNPTIFPGVLNTPAAASRFWGATVLAGDATKRWTVVHGGVGQMTYVSTTDLQAFRCVRGTGAPLLQRFDTSTSGVIKDNETSLTWEASPPNSVHDLAQATTYCAGLNLVGTGWRLPAIRELATLPDPLMTVPALPAYFNPLSTWYWSSTPAYNATPPQNWAVQMGLGFSQPEATYSNPRVRCVR